MEEDYSDKNRVRRTPEQLKRRDAALKYVQGRIFGIANTDSERIQNGRRRLHDPKEIDDEERDQLVQQIVHDSSVRNLYKKIYRDMGRPE